jgi:hypothetical protein
MAELRNQTKGLARIFPQRLAAIDIFRLYPAQVRTQLDGGLFYLPLDSITVCFPNGSRVNTSRQQRGTEQLAAIGFQSESDHYR